MWWIVPILFAGLLVILPPLWITLNSRLCARFGGPKTRLVLRTWTTVLCLSVWQATTVDDSWQRALYAALFAILTFGDIAHARISTCVVLVRLLVSACSAGVGLVVLLLGNAPGVWGKVLFCAAQPMVSAVVVLLQRVVPEWWRSHVAMGHILEVVVVFGTYQVGGSWWREPLLSLASEGLGVMLLYPAVIFIGPRWACAFSEGSSPAIGVSDATPPAQKRPTPDRFAPTEKEEQDSEDVPIPIASRKYAGTTPNAASKRVARSTSRREIK